MYKTGITYIIMYKTGIKFRRHPTRTHVLSLLKLQSVVLLHLQKLVFWIAINGKSERFFLIPLIVYSPLSEQFISLKRESNFSCPLINGTNGLVPSYACRTHKTVTQLNIVKTPIFNLREPDSRCQSQSKLNKEKRSLSSCFMGSGVEGPHNTFH